MTMFTMLTLMPIPGRLPSQSLLVSRSQRTRLGLTTYQELVDRGHATCGMRLARNTIYSKRVALGWVTKFTRAMNLDLEVLDGHSLGADGVTDRLVAFMEFVADSADAKNDTGLALASTVATYASVWIDAHQLLPTPIDVTWLKPKVKEWKSGRTRNMTGAFGIIRKMQKAGITRDMMEQMYELDIWDSLCKGDPVLVVVVKAAGQLAFVMMLRRSEYTLVRGISEFNPHLRMTRSNIVWIGANGQPLLFDEEGNLDRDDLLALLHLVNDPETTLDDFHGRMDATVKTSKSDQTGEWSSHVHPIALRRPGRDQGCELLSRAGAGGPRTSPRREGDDTVIPRAEFEPVRDQPPAQGRPLRRRDHPSTTRSLQEARRTPLDLGDQAHVLAPLVSYRRRQSPSRRRSAAGDPHDSRTVAERRHRHVFSDGREAVPRVPQGPGH
jgi:hypothetical protein